jgi:hypothetical protein
MISVESVHMFLNYVQLKNIVYISVWNVMSWKACLGDHFEAQK